MKVINWKTSSDFLLLVDMLRDNENDVTVITFKMTPFGAFHLEILRHLYPHQNIVFVTRDDRKKRLIKTGGYPVFQSMQKMHQDLPEWYQIVQENLSPLDYVRFHCMRFLTSVIGWWKKIQPKSDIFSVKHSSWYMLVIGIVVILLLMVGIISLTSPHATITITPQTSSQKAMKNVTFLPEDVGQSETPFIPVQKIIYPFEMEKTYNVNTYDPATIRRAVGMVKIRNSGPDTLSFRPQTRVSVDTLVFRTDKWVEIPGAQNGIPWEATISVIADIIGNDGVLMGKKWNIPANTVMKFPWLSWEDQIDLSVSSVSDFAWGEDVYKNLLTQDEYTRIEKIYREYFTEKARETVLAQYTEWREYIPLPIEETMSTLDMVILTDVKVGDHAASVTLSGKGNFIIYLYDVTALRNVLVETAKSHLLEGTESLFEVSESPPDFIGIISQSTDPWILKETTQLPVKVLYDFSSPAWEKSLQNILLDLLDSDIERAEKTLLNHPYIQKVDIRLTPFWTKKLPSNMSKISIKTEDIQS